MRRLLAGLLVVVAAAIWAGPRPDGPSAVAWSVAAWAQEGPGAALTEEEYSAWDRVANRADQSIERAKASTEAYETLRLQLVGWRARFQEAQKRDAEPIKTLKSRIDALGPPPENGETESEEIAARRQELNDEYQRLVTPVRRAEEAYARAQGLITRIDKLIRERQRDRLLERWPSPLNPVNVRVALGDLNEVVRGLVDEVGASLKSDSQRTVFLNNLPQIALLVSLALLLLAFGRQIFHGVINRLVAHRDRSDQVFVVAMILSLAQFILPSIGITALSLALRLTGFFGPGGEGLLDALAIAGMAFFLTRWIARQSFPKQDNWPANLNLSARQRVRGRFYGHGLGLLFAFAVMIETSRQLFDLQSATVSVLVFPMILLTGICLENMGRLIMASGMQGDVQEEGEEQGEFSAERHFFSQLDRFLGYAIRIFAIAGPVVAAAGFILAGVYATLSPSLSLLLFALVAFLQRLSSGLFRLFGHREKDGDGLFAVLANFGIVLASLPLFGLIWGARWADFDELWTTLNDGFSIGGVNISPSVVVVLLAVFGAGFLITRLLQGAVGSSVLPRTSLDPGAQKAVNAGLGYVGIALSGMVAVATAGLDLSNLAIVAGALSVGVGFGLQNIVSNFVSGLILLIERPVTEGDWVEVGGVMGTVRRISVRATTVETFDRTDIVVPNSDFVTSQFTNWTRSNLSGRVILNVGVAYGSDTRKVAAILAEIADEHPLVIVNPPPLIVFQGFGADALEFEMRVILRDINFGLNARTELNHRIAERFAEEGIEIPFAQRDIWLRNPDVLAASLAHRPAAAPAQGQTPPPQGAAAPAPPPDRTGAELDAPSEDDL
ncbi:DUF3772 domain-containing protein [Tropicimonas isoalkanivorans]|uniref:Small-conductance mechanosensitive channel n=1 Tax=Tropicimonas isoalkanivorans TaxID=441112 RepID=A0A1I1DIV3_9RHOB|nr:DUF3772 domain-containing protein [Tropicimonas isoalkanivorans]SFB74764.1 Small-conductance mechanosensitive channel [Tropicimonas isoalkanivorans]